MTRNTAVRLEVIERRQNLREEQQAKARADEQWIEDSRAETILLEHGRNGLIDVPIAKRGERRKPMRRKSGLQWLHDKGKLGVLDNAGGRHIADKRLKAGERYGDDYCIATDLKIRSILDQTIRGIGEGPADVVTQARIRLDRARGKGLHAHPAMIEACDAICGEGRLPRYFGKQRVDACIATLAVALDLLVEHYGLA